MEQKTVGESIVEVLSTSDHPMSQKELVYEVFKIRNERKPNEQEVVTTQPTVSKALKTLLSRKQVVKTENKTYYKYSENHAATYLRNDIIQTVIFTKDVVYPISDTVLLLGVEAQCSYTATELLRAYIGKDRCFDVVYLNGYLVVLLTKPNGTKFNQQTNIEQEKLKQIQDDLQDIVLKAIEEHAKKKRTLIKMIEKASTSEEGQTEEEPSEGM